MCSARCFPAKATPKPPLLPLSYSHSSTTYNHLLPKSQQLNALQLISPWSGNDLHSQEQSALSYQSHEDMRQEMSCVWPLSPFLEFYTREAS